MAIQGFERATKRKAGGSRISLPFIGRKEEKAVVTASAPPIDLAAEVEALRAENESLRLTLAQSQKIQGATLERFRTTFYEMPLPAFTVNDEGSIMEWNQAATMFFDRIESEVVDKPIASVLGDQIFRQDAEGMIFMVFLGMHPAPIELDLRLESGEIRRVKWHASPVKNQAGQVVGALNTLGLLPRF